jgi:hypothetical protein
MDDKKISLNGFAPNRKVRYRGSSQQKNPASTQESIPSVSIGGEGGSNLENIIKSILGVDVSGLANAFVNDDDDADDDEEDPRDEKDPNPNPGVKSRFCGGDCESCRANDEAAEDSKDDLIFYTFADASQDTIGGVESYYILLSRNEDRRDIKSLSPDSVASKFMDSNFGGSVDANVWRYIGPIGTLVAILDKCANLSYSESLDIAVNGSIFYDPVQEMPVMMKLPEASDNFDFDTMVNADMLPRICAKPFLQEEISKAVDAMPNPVEGLISKDILTFPGCSSKDWKLEKLDGPAHVGFVNYKVAPTLQDRIYYEFGISVYIGKDGAPHACMPLFGNTFDFSKDRPVTFKDNKGLFVPDGKGWYKLQNGLSDPMMSLWMSLATAIEMDPKETLAGGWDFVPKTKIDLSNPEDSDMLNIGTATAKSGGDKSKVLQVYIKADSPISATESRMIMLFLIRNGYDINALLGAKATKKDDDTIIVDIPNIGTIAEGLAKWLKII